MARDKGCKWNFEQQTGIDQGPTDALVLNFSKFPYSSLVRESIQNSIDAALDNGKPVSVRFEMKSIAVIDFPSFFDLGKHIQGCIDFYPKDPKVKAFEYMLHFFETNSLSDSIGYIKITDSNTKGMPYRQGDTNCPFYAFALSRGVSSKSSDTAGGSFGFGKAAYFNMSPIRTIMVSTMTPNGQCVFEGISSLCTHTYKGQKLTSVGYYDNNSGKPITDENEIPVPFKCKEPGTAISIIGIDIKNNNEAITEMKEAVLRNFWMAIWKEKLEVQIGEELINKETIPSFMEMIFPNDTDTTKHSNYYNPRPYFDAVRFAGTMPQYKEVHSKYLHSLGEVKLYVNEVPNGNFNKDKVLFMRKPLMSVYTKRIATYHGCNLVFVCEGDKGNNILRQLENPSHDEWKPENWKDATNHTEQRGRLAIQEIQEYLSQTLFEIFHTDNSNNLQITGLEDYLYVPEEVVNGLEKPPVTQEGMLSGSPTGDLQEDGSSVTNQLDSTEPPQTNDNPKAQTGHVIVSNNGHAHKSSTGSRLAGTIRSHTGHGQRHKTSQAGSSFSSSNIEEGDGSFFEYIPVTYRVVAQKEYGRMYHSIIFHSPQATNKGEIELVVGGEQANEVVDIVETNVGAIRDNFITGLNVIEGRNEVRVRFGDNIKHAVILKAYERK